MKVTAALAALLAFAPAFARSRDEVPFQLAQTWTKPWNSPPNADVTGHLIFNNLNSLLQRWSNTLFRNGHSLVPATIPAGTVLYHGRTTNSTPTVPEWLAFDFEHAYLFCHSDCYVLSVVAKRPLKLLYFDGAAASKMSTSTMDSQDVLAWGKVRIEQAWNERERITLMCEWGKKYGLDGFVRMEFHFEVMYCDFSDGLEVMSTLNLLPKSTGNGRGPPRRPEDGHEDDRQDMPPPPEDVQGNRSPKGMPPPRPWGRPPLNGARPPPGQGPPGGPGGPPGRRPGGGGRPWPPSDSKPPAGWKGSLPGSYVLSEALNAGSWHDPAPGETRVQPDYSRFVTFYDASLTSLVEARRGVDHLHHRLLNISSTDAERKMEELVQAIMREGEGSRVDWGSVTRVVSDRYAQRLEFLKYTLEEPNLYHNTTEQAASIRSQILTMLAPYMTTTTVPEVDVQPGANISWAAAMVDRCANAHTSGIPLGMLTPQEHLIYDAVRDTGHEICRRLTLMWVDAFDIEEADTDRVGVALAAWKTHVNELMAWLDWAVWLKCNPACGTDSMCYIPTWPFPMPGDDPEVMTPRCLRRDWYFGGSG
ncbi:hypothetical protein OF83DRAFT_1174142 [Amylostereum chailletii]|nr:hypothetical protein OF83DRAFT_1174142 [Amylostereum chailletii]